MVDQEKMHFSLTCKSEFHTVRHAKEESFTTQPQDGVCRRRNISRHFPLPGSSTRIKEARTTLPFRHKKGGPKVNKLYSYLAVFLFLFLVPLFPAWGSEGAPGPAKPAWEDQWKAIVEAAKKEGELRRSGHRNAGHGSPQVRARVTRPFMISL